MEKVKAAGKTGRVEAANRRKDMTKEERDADIKESKANQERKQEEFKSRKRKRRYEKKTAGVPNNGPVRFMKFPKRDDPPYPEDVDFETLKAECAENYLVCDPGKRDVLTIMDAKEEKMFKYSYGQQMFETKVKKFDRRQNNLIERLGIRRIQESSIDVKRSVTNVVAYAEAHAVMDSEDLEAEEGEEEEPDLHYLSTDDNVSWLTTNSIDFKRKVKAEKARTDMLLNLYSHHKFRTLRWHRYIERKVNLFNIVRKLRKSSFAH